MRSTGVLLGIGLGIAAASGCGGKAIGGGSGPVAQGDFPGALVHAICAGLGACCPAGTTYSQSSCESVLGMSYESKLVKDPASYDADLAGECIDGISAVVRRCDFSASTETDACRRLTSSPASGSTHGNAGDACNSTCSTQGSATSCSAVSVGVSADAGAPPPQDAVTCYGNDGLYCDYAHGRCAPLGKEGASCSSSEECASSFCAYGQGVGVCAAKLGAGSACTLGEGGCATGLACSASGDGYRCSAPKALGAQCESTSECQSGSCRDGVCSLSSSLLRACGG